MSKPGTTSIVISGLSLMLLGALRGTAGPMLVEAQTARDRAGTPAPQAARLAGRVVDAADGRQGVRRAIVTMTGKAYSAGRSAITDDQGRFAFERVPAGEFALSATRPGYIKATYGAARPGRPGTPIAITVGRDVLDVTLVMAHGSAIDGVLRDTVGDPAPGMRVEAVRILHGRTGDRGETAGVSLTDDRGEYRLFGLSAGDYVVVATPSAIISGIGDIGAPSESEVDALFAALQRRAGAPAPQPPSPGTPAPSSLLPAMKGYSTPPTYYPGVLASGEATRISLGANDDRDGMDFSVRMSHSAAIDGQIVPIRGQTVPQLQIGIHGAGPELPVFGGSASGPSVSSRASDRTFHISNVPPGHYRITARTFGAPGSSTAVISGGGALPSTDASAGVQWAVADVDVAGDDFAGITLALQPALHVTGRLAFDASTLRPPGAASVRLALEPMADDDNAANGLTMALPGTVRSDGTFEFPAVIPGGYRLTASVAGGWWLRSAMVNAVDVLDGGLKVGASDVGGLTLTLSDRHTAIAGTLSGTTGRPATDYFVVAFPADRAMWRAPSRRVLSTRPTTTGAFELSDLPPGAYCLAVLTDIEPADLDDPSFLESLLPVALTISIGEGERKIQNMRIGG